MFLLKNHRYQYLTLAALMLIGGYFCTVSLVWSMVFASLLAPLILGYMLRLFFNDHDFAEMPWEDRVNSDEDDTYL